MNHSFPRILSLVSVALLLSAAANAGPVNINTADAATLARELKGVGEHKAQAIVAWRQQHGAFHNADELALVKGIGPKLIERNRADIRVSGANAPTPAAPAVTGPPPRPKPATPGISR